MPLFRGTFSKKCRIFGIRFLEYVRNYGYHFKKHAEFWVPFLEKYFKIIRREIDINKVNVQ